MTARVWFWCLGSCLVSLPAAADPNEQAPLRPADFAYGRDVALPESPQPVVRVELPIDVYRVMRGPGLVELMVFNGRGAQVPHAIGGPPEQPVTVETAVLPFFPITVEATKKASSGGLALDVERDAQGEVIRIAALSVGEKTGAAEPAPAQPIESYVLDARAVSRPIVALNVQLEGSADARILPLQLEASDTLVTFRPISVQGAIVQLGHGGDRIDSNLIELPASESKFYRLRPANLPSFPAPILRVTATLASTEAERVYERLVVRPAQAPKPNIYRFDLGGPVPVDRIDVELPETNTIVNAELAASDKPDGPYYPVERLRLYRVTNAGVEARSLPFDLERRDDRYYELRIEAKGGGVGSGSPALVAYRIPDDLVFLRRGDGPFTVAYGRYRVDPVRFEADDLLSLLPKDNPPAARGALGPQKTLGGPERLIAPDPPPPYKAYVVWGVLILGVLLLGGLAFHLARERQ